MKNQNVILAVIVGVILGSLCTWFWFGERVVTDRDEMNGMHMMRGMGDGSMSEMMNDMAYGLRGKTGDEFDREFLDEMIVHHEGAVDMAKLSEAQAKHDEIKQLSKNILTTQTKEINDMKSWMDKWGYR